MCLLATLHFLWKNIYPDPLPIFKLDYVSFLLLSAYSLDTSPLSDIVCCTQDFNFDVVQFMCSLFFLLILVKVRGVPGT